MVLRIFKMIAISGFLANVECTKFVFGRGSTPTPQSLQRYHPTYPWGRWNRETWQDGTRSNSTIEQRGPWAE